MLEGPQDILTIANVPEFARLSLEGHVISAEQWL